MYDGSEARFERIRYIDGAFVLPILPNGNILLTEQEQPARGKFYSLPGGALDPEDPTPLAGAKREFLEETGYGSDHWVSWCEFSGTAHAATYVYYYIARQCYPVSAIQPDPGEKIRLFEVSFDEFLLLSSDKRFHHHWNLLPILYEARLDQKKYRELKKMFFDD